jgi:hypothetical protein
MLLSAHSIPCATATTAVAVAAVVVADAVAIAAVTMVAVAVTVTALDCKLSADSSNDEHCNQQQCDHYGTKLSIRACPCCAMCHHSDAVVVSVQRVQHKQQRKGAHCQACSLL